MTTLSTSQARLLAAGLLSFTVAGCGSDGSSSSKPVQTKIGVRSDSKLTVDGLEFKDLNHDGVLEPYEDWRNPPEVRAKDLVSRMTLAEKAGSMMHGTAPTTSTGYDLTQASTLITTSKITAFITRLSLDPKSMADQYDQLQAVAEQSRLGIPISLSSDPRNHFQYTAGASVSAGSFSQWPEVLGFGAIGDPTIVKQFGDIARQEYRAVGITQALSPQADLATEPRWARINGTFGEDADSVKPLVQAYIEGFQNGTAGIGNDSVIAVVKHFAGYGAQRDGFDSHNYYGRYQTFPAGNFAYHLKPFEGAFAANVGSVMPTYSEPYETLNYNGEVFEQVGAGFSKQMLTDVLRTKMGFKGVVLTDWQIVDDCVDECMNGAPPGVSPFLFFSKVGMPWGVETLSKEQRYAKAVNAGVDQFGGVNDTDILISTVAYGDVTQDRVDDSVYRIMLQRFELGLFDNPYVDVDAAATIVGNADFQAKALDAQRKSLVLLQNNSSMLPFSKSIKKVYLYGIDSSIAAQYGLTAVGTPQEADVAILRVSTPFEKLHPTYVFGSGQHEGSLAFVDGNADYEAIKAASAAGIPTVVTVYMDRPAILTNVQDKTAAILANFGVNDTALFDVLTGVAKPSGKLPFELPSSMAEVEAQYSDLPHDTANPLYKIGFGLSY